jgi:hypothetical protein
VIQEGSQPEPAPAAGLACAQDAAACIQAPAAHHSAAGPDQAHGLVGQMVSAQHFFEARGGPTAQTQRVPHQQGGKQRLFRVLCRQHGGFDAVAAAAGPFKLLLPSRRQRRGKLRARSAIKFARRVRRLIVAGHFNDLLLLHLRCLRRWLLLPLLFLLLSKADEQLKARDVQVLSKARL